MRYTKISKRLCSERGAFLTELAMTGSVVPPNFGFAPEETAEYLDTAPDGKPRMMIKWKGNRIPIALGRMFRAGNLPETPEFASLRVGMKPWFNDDIINVYLEGLQQKLKPKHFCLLNTHYSNNEAKFEKAKYTKMLKKVGAETCQRAVILYNKDSNHWAVFYAERNGDAMRVYHYDSFTPRRQHRTYGSLKELFDDEKVVGENPKPGDPGYNFRTGANVLCELWNPEHKETDPLPATLVGFRVPQQDGFNCGVFASLTVSLLMAGNRSDFLHDVDLVAYIDGVEGRKEGREDGQKGNVSHAEAIALRMRMYVFNMLRPLAVPLREPPASDSDIEVWQEDEEPKKKGRKNGGSRIKRTRKRFFSSPRIKRTYESSNARSRRRVRL